MDPKPSQLTRRKFVLGSLAAVSLAGLRVPMFGATAQASTGDCSYVPWESRSFLNARQLHAAQNEMAEAGYRIVDITGYDVLGKARYAAVWQQAPSDRPHALFFFGQTEAQFLAEHERVVALGYVPVRVRGYVVSNTTYYASIWEQDDTKWSGSIDLTAAGYQREHDRLARKGFVAADLNGYVVGGVPLFAGIFEKQEATRVTRTQLTRPQLVSLHEQLAAVGYRLLRLSAYSVHGLPYYAGIWDLAEGSPNQVLFPVQARGALRRQIDEMRYRGFAPAALCGFHGGAADRYASVWDRHGLSEDDEATLEFAVNAFMHGWDPLEGSPPVLPERATLPGLSLAFVKNGRLVYARGFGAARLGENGALDVPVTVQSRFRIASASKTVTAGTVMKLVYDQAISLDDTVFGAAGWLGSTFQITADPSTPAGSDQNKAWVNQITVRHLLEHSVAGWGNNSFFVLSEEPERSQDSLIAYALNTYPLSAAPGETLDYSGFCYLLLGRIVEQVTGQPYETYVQQVILDGASTVGVASDIPAESRREVHYYAERPIATTLAADLPADATELTVTSGVGFPYASRTLGTFLVEIDDEVVRVIETTDTLWKVVRAADDTVAAAHLTGATVMTQEGTDPYSFSVARAKASGGLAATPIDLARFMSLVDGYKPPEDLVDLDTLKEMVTASEASLKDTAEGPVPYGLGWILNKPLDGEAPEGGGPHRQYYGAGSLAGTHSVMIRTQTSTDVYCTTAVINTQIERTATGADFATAFGRNFDSTDLFNPMSLLQNTLMDSWPCYDLF